jgi:hypothetical protein
VSDAMLVMGIINLILLVWFILILTSINRGIDQLNRHMKQLVQDSGQMVTMGKRADRSQAGEASKEGFIQFVCPKCREKNSVAKELVGGTTLCQKCNEPFKVPDWLSSW